MPRPDVPLAVQLSLDAVLDYLWDDEEHHWLESGQPAQHIFQDLACLETWLNGNVEEQ